MYILFTNYNRYVDEFIGWAREQLVEGGRYTMLSGAGGMEVRAGDADPASATTDAAWKKHQMPAYHLVSEDGSGITLVNIGVGPSNAKTITDHLAVMRPEAWLMIGHCGGLRPSQRIGDYVLAHAYLRDDHILDDVLPPEIPVPAIAEVQVALSRGAERVSGESLEQLKGRMRTGTVVTTDDRNWELALHIVRAPLQPEPRRGDRHGERHARRAGFSFSRALRHLAVRLGQADPWRDQAARPGQPLLRARDRRGICASASPRSTSCAWRANSSTAAS